jgi:Rrf2 family protein
LLEIVTCAIKDVKVQIPFSEKWLVAMISQTIEYALRALVTIAQHEGEPCTAQKIAEISKVPAPYLSKMMQVLVRAELVTSKRGLHGGFELAKAASDLTILEIVNAVDPIKRIRRCPLEIDAHEGTLCPLHRRMDIALALVEQSFRETTVAELLSPQGSVTPLCKVDQFVGIGLGDGQQNSAEQSRRHKGRG